MVWSVTGFFVTFGEEYPTITIKKVSVNPKEVFGYVETFVSNQKELYEQMLTSKDEEIARLE